MGAAKFKWQLIYNPRASVFRSGGLQPGIFVRDRAANVFAPMAHVLEPPKTFRKSNSRTAAVIILRLSWRRPPKK